MLKCIVSFFILFLLSLTFFSSKSYAFTNNYPFSFHSVHFFASQENDPSKDFLELLKSLFSFGQPGNSNTPPSSSDQTSPTPPIANSPSSPTSPPPASSPTALAGSCPIPNGQITCGTRTSSRNNCNHCSEQYIHEDERNNPTRQPSMRELCQESYGTPYALDIAASAGTPIYLPSLNGHIIEWEYKGEVLGSAMAIQKYIGTDIMSGEKYYIQFHHTVIGSGNPGFHSTEQLVRAGIVADIGANHIHVQLASGNAATGSNWLDTANYLCK